MLSAFYIGRQTHCYMTTEAAKAKDVNLKVLNNKPKLCVFFKISLRMKMYLSVDY